MSVAEAVYAALALAALACLLLAALSNTET